MNRQWKAGLGVGLALAVVLFTQAAAAEPPKPATDQEIRQLIKDAGDAAAYDHAAVVVLLDEADVYVQASGLATTESCQVVKILTDAGIRSYASLRQEFDPATNRITFKQVRIHRAGGGIEDVPVSEVFTQPAPQHAIYWGNQQHVLDLPRLEIGDCLEIRISKIGFNIAYLAAGEQPGGGGPEETLQPPMPGHWYETTLFQGSTPVVRKRYTVHMPKDKPVQYEEYNGPLQSSFWFGPDTHILSWWAKDLPPIKSEPYMTAPDDNVPKLVMATLPDWFMKSRWFFEVNEPQFEADDAIRAKVRELTEGLPDMEAKIRACLHWVADNVRYVGTSRGPCEGFTLHQSVETFRDRGGVCKDKAGMLVTMLRVLGLEVYPALTMAGSRVERIPADQFNHTVTVIRNEDGSFRVLDPTWSPLSREVWSSWEALQGLVYGTPEGQDLTLSPYFPPEHNALAGKAATTLTPEGTLQTHIVMDMKGSPCTAFRRGVERNPRPDQRGVFEQALAIAPNARLEALKWTSPLDYSRDSQVDLQVSAESYALGNGSLRMFRLPLMSRPLNTLVLADLNYPLSAAERKFDLRLRASRRVCYEETIKLPPGWELEQPLEARKLESGSATLTFEPDSGEGTLSYRFTLTILHNIIPAKDYPGYKKAIDAMNELRDLWVVCRVRDDSRVATGGVRNDHEGEEVTHD